MPNDTLLLPARDVDLTDVVPRYEASTRAYRLMADVAIGRTLEMAQGVMGVLGERLAVRPLAGNDWVLRKEDAGTPWTVAISAMRPDGSGFLYGLDFEPVLTGDVLRAHAPELLAGAASRPGTAEEDAKATVERSEALAALQARIRREGITDDALRPLRAGALSVQAFRRKPSRATAHNTLTLAKALDALGEGRAPDCLVRKGGPDRADRRGESPIHREGDLSRNGSIPDVVEALRVLRAAVHTVVPGDLIRKRNEDIGARVYETLFTAPEEILVQELAQGLVHSDGGLMGGDTRQELEAVRSRDIEREVAGAFGDLLDVLPLLREAGHLTRKDRYEANDGRTAMWTRHPDAHRGLALMCSGHATYAARLRDDGDILELARVGGPDTREARIDIGTAFALDAPGMRGAYHILPDGTASTLNAPPSGDVVRAEIHDMATLIQSVAAAAREEYGDAPRGP